MQVSILSLASRNKPSRRVRGTPKMSSGFWRRRMLMNKQKLTSSKFKWKQKWKFLLSLFLVIFVSFVSIQFVLGGEGVGNLKQGKATENANFSRSFLSPLSPPPLNFLQTPPLVQPNGSSLLERFVQFTVEQQPVESDRFYSIL